MQIREGAERNAGEFISGVCQEIRIEENAVIVNGRRTEFPYTVETVVRFRDSFAVLIMGDKIRDENVYALDYSGKILWNIAEITDFKRKQGYTAIGKRDGRTLMAQAFSGIRCLADMERGVLVGKEITK